MPCCHSLCQSVACYCLTGAIPLQTVAFPIAEEIYTKDGVLAVISVSCVKNETLFDECSWIVTDITTDDRCSIDHVAEVVCQGTYACLTLIKDSVFIS